MSNPLIHYDPESDTLHLAFSDEPSIVSYTSHPHVAHLKNLLGDTIGFHIEAVSEFIKPGIIGELETLKELARDKALITQKE